jgi:hypothetical protein
LGLLVGEGSSLVALGTSCLRLALTIPETGWKRSFDDPIPLARGRPLVTLEDAGNPKAEHEAPESQAAMEALILVATSSGPTMFARIGVTRALNRHVERKFNPSREKKHWGKRELARDR